MYVCVANKCKLFFSLFRVYFKHSITGFCKLENTCNATDSKYHYLFIIIIIKILHCHIKSGVKIVHQSAHYKQLLDSIFEKTITKLCP